jgi:hypothetical protein
VTTNAQVAQWLTPLSTSFASMSPVRHAYSVDDAPITGGDFVTILLTRQYGGPRLNDGSRPSGLWRLIVRAVGVGESNANTLLDRASGVIENRRITIGGVVSTGAEFETQEPVGEDETDSNLWSGMRSYTYGFDAQ